MLRPAFMEELRLPSHRHKLWLGVWSGYFMAAAFAVLTAAAQVLEIVAWAWPFYVIIGGKIATNTVALLSLRADRLVLETQGINTLGDVLLMTGGVYFTGGEVSPLFPIYVIELSVVALLSNLAVTIMTSAIIWVSYCAMAVLTYVGVLPQQSAPAIIGVDITASYLATDLVLAAFVIGVPTVYISIILRSLSSKRKELEQRNRELVDAGRQKAQFMANVTHELRTPIHGISGLTELLESGIYGPLSDKQAKAVESIRRSATGQLQLVDQLLQLSRAEVGKLEVRPAVVEPAHVVEHVASAVRWMLGTKDMTLEVTVSPGLAEMVTDRVMLTQCLLNLASNAAKFTPAGGRVEISAQGVGEDVLFRVRDNGPGIPAHDRDRVFDAFRQLDATDERSFGGVGLGLSLVRRLVTELCGTIELDSVEGEGSTFTITLPRRLPEAQGDPGCSEAHSDRDGSLAGDPGARG